MAPHLLERQVKARSCPEVFARAESVSCASPVPGSGYDTWHLVCAQQKIGESQLSLLVKAESVTVGVGGPGKWARSI